jgi:Uma2 family endonuclease
VCVELWRLLDDHVRAHGAGIAACSPLDIEYSPRRMVQPDVFVVPFANGRVPKGWDRMPRPLLVAEVSSPSTVRYDRKVKRRMYQEEKVPEYWVVQPHASLIERWTPGDVQPAIHDEVLVWRPTPEVAALTIDVAAFFDGVHALFEDDAGW